MLLKFGRIFGIAVAGVALANVAHAEDVAVMTSAASTRLGGEFRAEGIYTQDKVAKQPLTNHTPQTEVMQVSDLNLLLNGNLNKDTEYAVRFNLLNPVHGPLDYGYGTHWFNDWLAFSMGKERVLQGGWDHMDEGYRSHAIGAYADNLAFNDFDYMLALHFRLAGIATVQLTNDVVADPNSANLVARSRYNTSEHPTVVVGWLGDFGVVQPLLDYSSYDNSKSNYFDVGLKFRDVGGFKATLDYHWDHVGYRLQDNAVANSLRKEHDTKEAYTANISYNIKNAVSPWVYYSHYNDREAGDSRAIGNQGNTTANVNYNSATMTPANGNIPAQYAYAFNDNGNTWGAGVDFNNFGKYWNPFVAYVAESGVFLKDQTNAGLGTETRTIQQIKIGVLGQI